MNNYSTNRPWSQKLGKTPCDSWILRSRYSFNPSRELQKNFVDMIEDKEVGYLAMISKTIREDSNIKA